MPVLTIPEIAGAWQSAGATQIGIDRRIEFAAICLAESGGNTDAVSPAGALGLWQVMPFNFAPLGLDVNQWRDPFVNARAALLLSNQGQNCAAWDSCYNDIAASGRFGFLNWPQPQSSAFGFLSQVSLALGRPGAPTQPQGGQSPAITPNFNAAGAAWGQLQDLFTTGAVSYAADLSQLAAATRKLGLALKT